MTPDYTRMTTEDLSKAYSQNQTAMAMMAGMAAINPIFGAFGVWATNNTKKKIIEAGYKPPEGGSIFDLSINDLVGKVKDVLGLSDEQTKAVVAQVSGGEAETVTPTQQPPTVSTGGGGDDDPFKDVKAQVAATKAKGEELKKTNTDVASASAEYESNQAAEAEMAEAAEAGGATQGGPGGTYGMNAGGFVSKRSKKKKK